MVRRSTHFHFIPCAFCIYAILMSSFLQGSTHAPSESTEWCRMTFFVNPSLHSPVWIIFPAFDHFWNYLCPSPSPSPSFAIPHYCWMWTCRWGSNIFCNIFCSLHAVSFHRLGFQPPTQGGKVTHQQAKAACFNLDISGHELAASSKCLCLLVYLWDFKEMGFSHDALSKQLRYQTEYPLCF